MKNQEKIIEQILEEDFWWVYDRTGQKTLFVYQTDNRLLWEAAPDARLMNQSEAQRAIKKMQTIQRDLPITMRAPAHWELRAFALHGGNPIRDEFASADFWHLMDGRTIDPRRFLFQNRGLARLIGCARLDSVAEFIALAEKNGLILRSVEDFSNTIAFAAPAQKTASHPTPSKAPDVKRPSPPASKPTPAPKTTATATPAPPANSGNPYLQLDYSICRLPVLEANWLTDPDKGLWEAWPAPSDAPAELQDVRPRNPADDVKDWNIGIDFGTSSTVVAYDDNGQHKLLRVGVKDFSDAPQPGHYENPTVLEFLDFQAMLQAWQKAAYRPALNWEHVRCSHEALHNWRNNESNPKVVASILGKLKQWALRQERDRSLRITDQQHAFEHELALLQQRNPVKGKPLALQPDDAFDPVELYAWFLGMNINWRGRGLFPRYYMTFPVAYSREVKERILSSFRRGLQRSLPLSLVEQPGFLNRFSVEEIASEPAAYAAAALPHLGIDPTETGLAYAVFDFGGGTADFDFGLYRLPTPDEEERGTEVVFEHLGNEGDRFLGGENLLENLAYRMFCENLDECRDKKIVFSQPLDADDFPGSELFLEKTQAATTNSLMLMARLRPLWEQGRLENTTGVEKINLLTRNGEKASCELSIPLQALQAYLEDRIEQGIRNFFIALKKAFTGKEVAEFHVLLAGNASRCGLVAQFFDLDVEPVQPVQPVAAPADGNVALWVKGVRVQPADAPQESSAAEPKPDAQRTQRMRDFMTELFAETQPRIVVHPPLAVNAQALYEPTAKTGVALGLLKLCPGGVIDVIEHGSASTGAGDQAPFAHYVGRIRLGKFQPVLQPGCAYHGWSEAGVPRNRVFNLCHTQMPRASTGEMREAETGLNKQRLDLAGNLDGAKVFIRAKAPGEIEYCTAVSAEAAEQGQLENLQSLML